VVERIERYEVASFIRHARSVSSDAQVEQEALNSLLGTRAELPIPFWTSTTTRITGLMIRFTSRKSRIWVTGLTAKPGEQGDASGS